MAEAKDSNISSNPTDNEPDPSTKNDDTIPVETKSDTKTINKDTELKMYVNSDGQSIEENIDIKTNTINYKKVILKSNDNTGKTYPLGRVWMNIKGQTNNNIIFQNEMKDELSFILGQNKHCLGIEMSLSNMNINDHCVVYIYNKKYSYSDSCSYKPTKYPDINDDNKDIIFPLKFELILCDAMERIKDLSEMSLQDKIEFGSTMKDKGNKRYELKRFKTALSIYKIGIECIESIDDGKSRDVTENLYMNAAMFVYIAIYYCNNISFILTQYYY